MLFAFLQSIAVTEKYGLGIITLNLVMFTLVASFWFWEASIQKNDFTPQKQPSWKYWVIPTAFLAFWYPCSISGVSAVQDFNPVKLLTNEAGLTFCMMTPVYLSILTLYHPRVVSFMMQFRRRTVVVLPATFGLADQMSPLRRHRDLAHRLP